MKIIDLTKVLKGKAGKWVSLSPDNKKVIAESKTLKGLISKLKTMGDPDGSITNVAKDYSMFIG